MGIKERGEAPSVVLWHGIEKSRTDASNMHPFPHKMKKEKIKGVNKLQQKQNKKKWKREESEHTTRDHTTREKPERERQWEEEKTYSSLTEEQPGPAKWWINSILVIKIDKGRQRSHFTCLPYVYTLLKRRCRMIIRSLGLPWIYLLLYP